MTQQWIDVCHKDDMAPNSGVCALLGQEQVALFRVGEQQWFAIANHDPIGRANVLSRGMLAEVQGQLTVASPLYKHHFCLETGICLQDNSVKLPVYPVRVNGDRIELAA